mmetsp:Transcript_86997/g.218973  ORF Transcript_86997/g.218973 Transcript_86997/m.218973 type:complete len:276 (+) Transcript_86997:418-1245(+)
MHPTSISPEMINMASVTPYGEVPRYSLPAKRYHCCIVCNDEAHFKSFSAKGRLANKIIFWSSKAVLINCSNNVLILPAWRFWNAAAMYVFLAVAKDSGIHLGAPFFQTSLFLMSAGSQSAMTSFCSCNWPIELTRTPVSESSSSTALLIIFIATLVAAFSTAFVPFTVTGLIREHLTAHSLRSFRNFLAALLYSTMHPAFSLKRIILPTCSRAFLTLASVVNSAGLMAFNCSNLSSCQAVTSVNPCSNNAMRLCISSGRTFAKVHVSSKVLTISS